MKKGLICDIYSGTFGRDGLSTLPANVIRVCVTDAAGPFEPSEQHPEVVLVRRQIGGREYLHFEPKEANEAGKWLMFGGRFVHTSDSRFSVLSRQPIALHDRYELPAS